MHFNWTTPDARWQIYGGRVWCDGRELRDVSECRCGEHGFAVTRDEQGRPTTHAGHVLLLFGDDERKLVTHLQEPTP